MQDDSAPTTSTRRAKARLALSVISIAAVATLGLGLSADAGTENLLSERQQTFETRRDAGWAGREGASVGTSTAFAYKGERSMELRAGTTTAGGTTNPAAATVGGDGGVTVRAGATYEGSIWARSGSSTLRQVRCHLLWLRSDGTHVGAAAGTLVTEAAGRWQRATCTGTAPAGAVRTVLRVAVRGAASGERHYFDEAWLVDTGTTSAASTSSFAFRRNVGSTGRFVAASGAVFEPDSGFLGGNVFAGGQSEIHGTADDALYRKHRWGLAGYDVPVPGAGTYTVRLHFAETVMTRPGQRVFDVAAEGRTVLDDLDVQARVGTNVALVEQFTVNVTDGTLSLRFGAVVEDPMLSGLEVLGSGAVEVAATPTTTAPAPTTTAPPRTTTTTAPPRTTTTAPAPTTTAPPPTTTAPPAPAPAPAPSGSFPNASNTGVRPGTTLRASGSITTTAHGQVIENLDIRGSVFVNHNNVTIRNVRIRSAGQAIRVLGPTGLVVEDCELDGTGATDGASAIGDHNYTIRRCNVHHFGEGPRSNGNVVIEDNYFHSFLNFIGQGAHQDVVQITSGANHTIRHNTMLIGVDGANAAIMIGSYQGSNVLVENNLLGGGGYTAYCGASNGYTNVRYLNNRFSTVYYPRSGYHGPFLYCSNATLSGNVWHDGPNAGQPAG